jgi:hypothetical protein
MRRTGAAGARACAWGGWGTSKLSAAAGARVWNFCVEGLGRHRQVAFHFEKRREVHVDEVSIGFDLSSREASTGNQCNGAWRTKICFQQFCFWPPRIFMSSRELCPPLVSCV